MNRIKSDALRHPTSPLCNVVGCTRPRMLKDYACGKPRFRARCSMHTKKRRFSQGIGNDKCSACGWLGECNRHRVVPGKDGGRYTAGNVVVLCPNCHAAIHGKGDWNKLQTQTALREPVE